MRPHPGEQRAQVGELLPAVARHLAEQRPLSVHHLVMAQRQDEVLTERVQQSERQLVVVIAPVDGILGEVHQGVVHPPHVPFEPEAQAAQVGGAGDGRPGGGLLGHQHDGGVVAVDHLVELLDEVDGFQVLPAPEAVGDPLALAARIVQVEHGGDRIDAQAVDVKLLDPEQRVGEQEVPHLVAAVVEHQGAPVRMLAEARIGMLVQSRAVEARQRPVVLGEVPDDPVDENADAGLVQPVDQVAEVVGRPEPRRRRVVTGDLVAPGAAERVLRDREELDVRESQVGEVAGQDVSRLAVGQRTPPAVLLDQPPRAQMTFIDRYRGVQQVDGRPLGEPGRVLPLVPALGDDTRRRRRYLGGEGEGVRPQAELPVLADHLELVVSTGTHPGQEDLPDAGAAQGPHGVQAAVPAVEVAHDPDRLCTGRPHRE